MIRFQHWVTMPHTKNVMIRWVMNLPPANRKVTHGRSTASTIMTPIASQLGFAEGMADRCNRDSSSGGSCRDNGWSWIIELSYLDLKLDRTIDGRRWTIRTLGPSSIVWFMTPPGLL